jgi:hypothetical protein
MGQLLHCVAPGSAENDPGKQTMQLDDSVLPWYEPASHAVQLLAVDAEYVLAKQLEHPTAPAMDVEYKPAAQFKQLVALVLA